MQKRVLLTIDRQSWTTAPDAFKHTCPPAFPQAASTYVEVLASLLQVGTLTVPVKAANCSLAAYWAHVRYLTAVDLTSDFLQLCSEWEDIDAHQKTILSDDWGVGFTMQWLSTHLCYTEFCDGRYFIDRLKGLGIAMVEKPPKKRGTYKCPDFVTRDVLGKYHLIECKGTQSGSMHLAGQLTDGTTQKANIIFSDEQNQVGQRLVAGLFVAGAQSSERSLLAIADPPPRDRAKGSRDNPVIVRIREGEPERISDPLLRNDMARHLQVAGALHVGAEMLALPARGTARQQARRTGFSEAVGRFMQTAETVDDGWLGRTVYVPLAVPIRFNGHLWRAARLVHAVSRDYVKSLVDYDPSGETLMKQFPALQELRSEGTFPKRVPLGWHSEEEDSRAAIYRGGFFRSELQLE